MATFVPCERDQAFLLPPGMKDWLPEDDLAHFVIAAAERVPMTAFQVNERNSGKPQYHPRMMLALHGPSSRWPITASGWSRWRQHDHHNAQSQRREPPATLTNPTACWAEENAGHDVHDGWKQLAAVAVTARLETVSAV